MTLAARDALSSYGVLCAAAEIENLFCVLAKDAPGGRQLMRVPRRSKKY